MVWRFGMENWCNMQGRFVHFVADQSQQAAAANDSDTVSVCSVGIFGTKYVRDGPNLPEVIEIAADSSESIILADIYSQYEIATELDIKMRQGFP